MSSNLLLVATLFTFLAMAGQLFIGGLSWTLEGLITNAGSTSERTTLRKAQLLRSQ